MSERASERYILHPHFAHSFAQEISFVQQPVFGTVYLGSLDSRNHGLNIKTHMKSRESEERKERKEDRKKFNSWYIMRRFTIY